MSGGSFNYAYSHVQTFSEALGSRLDDKDKADEYGSKPNSFEPATLAKLKEIQVIADRTAALMREVEWLYSGNIGEESLIKRVAEIEGVK